MKKILLLCLLLALAPIGFAQEAGAPPSKPAKLISVEFQDSPLSTVLDILSLKTGRKFITDSELARKRIVLSLKEVSPEEAVDALLATYNLYYVRQADTNIYVIKNKTDMTVTTVSKIIFCNYASASQLEAVLKPKLTRAGTLSSDSRTNCLVVTDMADNVDKIESLVNTIDVPTLQVMLDAKIVDVKIDSDLKLGLELSNAYRTGQFWTDPLALERSRQFLDYKAPATSVMPQTGYSQGYGYGLQGSSKLYFNIITGGDYSLQGYFEAMKTDSDAKLLTNPKLLVLNNEEASIDIVDELPYETKTLTSQGNEVITTMFKEVGIKLKVKPQINRDGSIILTVAPEQSFRTGESLGNVPIVNTSKASTTLMLQNGDTAVIGGLIRETETSSEYKLPLIGDLPILGYLFKKSDKAKSRTELTIFITAKIVQ